jgi:hypothetical protein
MSTVTDIGAAGSTPRSVGAGAVVAEGCGIDDIIESLWTIVVGGTAAAAALDDPSSSPPQAAVPAARVTTASPTRN